MCFTLWRTGTLKSCYDAVAMGVLFFHNLTIPAVMLKMLYQPNKGKKNLQLWILSN